MTNFFKSEKDFLNFFSETSLKSDPKSFCEALDEFIVKHSTVIQTNCLKLPRRTTSFHFPKVSDDFLSCLQLHLWNCSQQLEQSYNEMVVAFAGKMEKTLIILSRSPNNIKLVAANEFLQISFSIFESLKKRNTSNSTDKLFMVTFLYFLECLYDPCFLWRQTIHNQTAAAANDDEEDEDVKNLTSSSNSNSTNKDADSFNSNSEVLLLPLSVHVQFVPFLHESLHDEYLEADIKLHLMALLLASVSGCQVNASKIICPATVQIVMTMLSLCSCRPDNNHDDGGDADVHEKILSLSLRSLYLFMWKIKLFTPEKRQVELPSIVECCWELLLKSLNIHSASFNIQLLDQLCKIVDSSLKDYQLIFVNNKSFTNLISFLNSFSKVKCDNEVKSNLLISCVKLFKVLLHSSQQNKETFKKQVGVERLVEVVTQFGSPSRELINIIISMTTESQPTTASSTDLSMTTSSSTSAALKNVDMVHVLLKLLLNITSMHEQSFLSSELLHLCSCCLHNMVYCSQNRVVSHLISLLSNYSNELDVKIVGDLFDLFECLASVCISPLELKMLMQLFEQQKQQQLSKWFMDRLMRTLTKVASTTDTNKLQITYWHFTSPLSGIKIENLQNAPGSGFTFHAWFCIDAAQSFRNDFNLFTLSTINNNNMCIQINNDGVLQVKLFNKKIQQEFVVHDCHIADDQWHSLDVVHSNGKRLFGQNQISIYVDEIVHLNSNTSFSVLSDNISFCYIGFGTTQHFHHQQQQQNRQSLQQPQQQPQSQLQQLIKKPLIHSSSSPVAAKQNSPTTAWNLFSSKPNQKSLNEAADSIDEHSTQQGNTTTTTTSAATTTTAATSTQHVRKNTLKYVSLTCRVAELMLFNESLSSSQIETLHKAGIDVQMRSNVENEALNNILLKTYLWYNAKACSNSTCYDLSRNSFNGKVVASICHIHNMKNTLNCVGGMQVVLALMDHLADEKFNQSVNVKMSGYVELLSTLLSDHPHNQGVFVQCDGAAVLGHLLRKVNPVQLSKELLTQLQKMLQAVNDFNVYNSNNSRSTTTSLSASTIMNTNIINLPTIITSSLNSMTNATNNNKIIWYQLLEFVLFDMRIWCHASQDVVLDLLEVLYSIILKDKRVLRKIFGVQYFLDSIHLYFSKHEDVTNASKPTSLTTTSTALTTSTLGATALAKIRQAAIKIIKLYVMKEITHEELHAITGTMCISDQAFALDLADLVISLLEGSSRNDQIYLLWFEPCTVELLYVWLSSARYSTGFKEKITKIIDILLRTTRVSESNKTLLKLTDSEVFVGFVHYVCMTKVAGDFVVVVNHLIDSIFNNESSTNLPNLLHVLHMCSIVATAEVKCKCLKKILYYLNAKPTVVKAFIELPAWSDAFVQLLSNNNSDAINNNNFNASDFSQSFGKSEGLFFNLDSLYEDDLSNKSSNIFKSTSFDDPYASKSSTLADNNDSHNDSNNNNIAFSPNSSLSSSLNFSLASSSSSSAAHPIFSAALSKNKDNKTLELSQIFKILGFSLHSLGLLSSSSSSSPFKYDELSRRDELMVLVLFSLYIVAWRSADGLVSVDDKLWKTRLTTISAFDLISKRNDVIMPTAIMTRRYFELLIRSCYNDLNHLSISSRATVSKNSLYLMKLLYYFLSRDQSPEKFSELLLQNIIDLTGAVYVLNNDMDLTAFEQLEIAFLLLFIGQPDKQLCSIAVAKLHELFYSKQLQVFQKVCYILALLDRATNLRDDSEFKEMLIPAFETLLEKAEDLLNLQSHLPDLPKPKKNSNFFNQFKIFQKTNQWKNFIEKHIIPSYEQYNANIFEVMNKQTDAKMIEAYDDLVVAVHRRNRQKQEFIIKFEKQYISCVRARETEEQKRLKSRLTHMCNQELVVKQRWKMAKKNFYSERGLWPEKTNSPSTIGLHTISPCENHLRMRPKLVVSEVSVNSSSSHVDLNKNKTLASSGDPGSDVMSELKMLEVKEMKVEENVDDQLNDEEWELINSNSVPSPSSPEPTSASTTSSATSPTTAAATTTTTSILHPQDTIMSQECELITIYEIIKGRLDITSTSLIFTNLSPGRSSLASITASTSTATATTAAVAATTTTATSTTCGHNVLADIPTVDVIRLPVDQLKEIHFRRYNLRRSALEFFLINQNNYFLNFEKSVRNKIYTRIIRLRPPNLVYYQSRSPAEIIKSSGLTQKWVQREMSNFEYLMQLNTISGRTYNDLSQYPVFPWVLSDYKSSTLNLDDPNVYRDLAWPIGAVNPRHREQLRDKYESLSDNSSDASDRFHYGTHYSNPAGVMHYLVRLEPFTSLHVQLQDGSFDVTDRQFHSLSSTWDTLMNNPNDVKELIPEFFYHPEFLVNVNDLDLGEMQNSDERFGDVILPPWASSANDFIDKHMQALESEYVSENLHKWVDLIFGYRQQGEAAVEALNVFYYCTYEGAVDLDAITDEKKKKALEGIIKNFGQAPSQLFKEPHPKRLSKREWLNQASKIDRVMCLFNSVNHLKIFQVQGAPSNGLPLVHVDIPNNQSYSLPQWNNASLNMICITADGVLGVHSWLPYDRNISNFFTFTSDVSMFNPRSQKKLFTSSSLATTYQSSSSASTVSSTMKLFVVTPDARLIVSGGHWDNSMRVFSLVKMKQITSIVYHTDVITCLAMDRLGKRLVTGSRDATCIVWEIIYKGSKSETINSTPLKLLYGHSTEITCLSLSWELDVVVSGSKDGLVVVYTLQDGLYVRTLQPPHAKGWMVSVEQMAMSHLGHICVFCKHQIINSSSNGSSSEDCSRSTSISTGEKEKLTMHLYSINGKHLSKEDLQDHVSDMIIHSGFLLVGFSSGQFVIKKLYGLKTEATQNFNSAIKCLAVSPGGSHLLVGLISGWIMILALDRVSELK